MSIMKVKNVFGILVLLGLSLLGCTPKQSDAYVGYLFAYFTGNGPGEEAVRYAVSKDGFTYWALNKNEAVLDSKTISSSGGVRDPHILRGEDGMFYMVLTDLYVPEMGWQNYAMILLKSPDLINWTHSIVNIPQTFPQTFGEVNRVWAPQTIYDPQEKKYMIYFSMRINQNPDIIYYAYANEDFTGLATEPKQLLFAPNNSASIDGDMVFFNGKYHFFFKNEDVDAKGIREAVSDKINEGFVVEEGYKDQTDAQVEGSGTFKMINSDKYVLMYDMYTSGKYQFCESTDLENFTVIDQQISMDFHPRHGCVIPITQKEYDALVGKWETIDDHVIRTAEADGVKKNNVVVDEDAGTVYLPVVPGTDVSALDPKFLIFPEATIEPSGAQNFTNGPVTYVLTLLGKTKEFKVSASADNNPVAIGYYADPEILYAHKDGKYHLYPTSDGFTGWSGTYFETFSSPDLSYWTPEGKILDLKDVSWADRNAWAPTIIEKKVADQYKYYYYFCAAQKIGVAIADDPSGPFVDSGAPVVNFKPEGISGGQEIDPDVFEDPVSGTDYLYWGNGYLAVAKLSPEMTAVDKASIKVLTPDATFREGAEVFYRKGTYYFLWSENDTRDADYRVRYATSKSPLGPLTIPEDNLVIAKDTAQAIYGTGHNSVINAEGTDDWYIVYHRFTRPKGITMGHAAGYNREVCIDKLEFAEDGSIIQAKPTLKGI